MAEYIITLTQTYIIDAKNEEEAEERAEILEGATTPVPELKVRWKWEMDSSQVSVEEG